MSVTSRTRFVNPRLGTYFGIFASSLAGLVMLLLIFEELGTSDAVSYTHLTLPTNREV